MSQIETYEVTEDDFIYLFRNLFIEVQSSLERHADTSSIRQVLLRMPILKNNNGVIDRIMCFLNPSLESVLAHLRRMCHNALVCGVVQVRINDFRCTLDMVTLYGVTPRCCHVCNISVRPAVLYSDEPAVEEPMNHWDPDVTSMPVKYSELSYLRLEFKPREVHLVEIRLKRAEDVCVFLTPGFNGDSRTNPTRRSY